MPATAKSDSLIRVQRAVLEMLAGGAPLSKTLEQLCRMIESIIPGAVTTVLMLDDKTQCLRLAAGPTVPPEWLSAFAQLKPGPRSASCGTAIYTGRPVIAGNTAQDERWADYREVAERFGIRACWSIPICTGKETPVASFAITQGRPAEPSDFHLQVLETAGYLAGIAIRTDDHARKLRESEQRYRQLYNQTPVMMHSIDRSGRIVEVNNTWLRTLGYSRAEVLGHWSTEFVDPDTREEARASIEALWNDGSCADVHRRFVCKSGEMIDVLLTARVETDAEGRPRTAMACMRDVTAQKRAEAQRASLEHRLRESHKMEALGQLAGGVAHDFNNILTAIIGNVELLFDQAATGRSLGKPDTFARNCLEQIRAAAQRATILTRQLLTFSDHEVRAPRIIDLSAAVRDAHAFVRQLLDERYLIELECAPGVFSVRADPEQIHEIIMNLALNATEAMPDGGTLRITLAPVDEHGQASATRTDRARLSLSDTGRGIAPDVLPRVFEPFFTTKPGGRGTGLGLSTVFGIVKKFGGQIQLDSHPGRGTTVHIDLPVLRDAAPQPPSRTASAPAGRGELILVCEDDPNVRAVTSRQLRQLNYEVVEAATGAEALETAHRLHKRIALLISDVIMPDMNGWQLADAIAEIRDDLPTLFVSGYTSDILDVTTLANERNDFLSKPYAFNVLAARVRALLDRFATAKT